MPNVLMFILKETQMNKSKQEFIKELNQQYVEHQTWMLEMPRSITTLKLVQRGKNPFFFREVKLIEVEGDWTHTSKWRMQR